jgi:hypothetical protein
MSASVAGFEEETPMSTLGLSITLPSSWMRIVLLCLGLLLCSALFAATARASTDFDRVWIVAKITGDAFVAEDEQEKSWNRLRGGEVLDGRLVVYTARDAAVVLTHGQDVVHLSGNSLVSLRETSGKGGMTRLAHTLGKILVEVEKRPGWQFQVETPYLTGVVKGTSFTVTVDGKGAQVDVHHGVVGVSDRGGRGSTDLKAGQSGRVSKDRGSKVSVGRSAASKGIVGRADAPAAALQSGQSSALSEGASSANGSSASAGSDKASPSKSSDGGSHSGSTPSAASGGDGGSIGSVGKDKSGDVDVGDDADESKSDKGKKKSWNGWKGWSGWKDWSDKDWKGRKGWNGKGKGGKDKGKGKDKG